MLEGLFLVTCVGLHTNESCTFSMAARRVNTRYSTREAVELVLNEGSDLEDASDSDSEENIVDSGEEFVPVDLEADLSDTDSDDSVDQRYNADTDVDSDQSADLLAPLPQPRSPSPPQHEADQVMYDDDSDSEWMYEWTRDLNNFPLPTPFSGTPGLSLPDAFDAVTPTPLHFYRLFITDQVIRDFKSETNRYAAKVCADKAAAGNLSRRSIFRTWKPVSLEEMTKFLSILIHMGLVKKPQITDYWSTHPALSTTFASRLLKRSRFKSVLAFFHLNDNATYTPRGQPDHDPLHKLRHLFDHLVEVRDLAFFFICHVIMLFLRVLFCVTVCIIFTLKKILHCFGNVPAHTHTHTQCVVHSSFTIYLFFVAEVPVAVYSYRKHLH